MSKDTDKLAFLEKKFEKHLASCTSKNNHQADYSIISSPAAAHGCWDPNELPDGIWFSDPDPVPIFKIIIKKKVKRILDPVFPINIKLFLKEGCKGFSLQYKILKKH